jgi:hypothetical protein
MWNVLEPFIGQVGVGVGVGVGIVESHKRAVCLFITIFLPKCGLYTLEHIR